MVMAADEFVEIRVLSGQSTQSVVGLRCGTRSNPFSVGTSGQWSIAAEGVGPVHLYLAFDGRDLHVAAAGVNAPVWLAGAPVGPQWAKATFPCEIRFGGARLGVRVAKFIGDLPPTLADGGALRAAAERAVAAAQRAQLQGADAAQPPPAPPQAPPQNVHGTVMMLDRPPLPVFDPHPRKAIPVHEPSTRPPKNDSPSAPSSPPRDRVPAKPSEGKLGELKAFWKASSPVKKASLVMAPFALTLAYWMLQAPPPLPPPVPLHTAGSTTDGKTSPTAPPASAAASISAPSPSAPVAATDGASSPKAPTASPAPAPSKITAESPKGGARGKRTQERQALDAVAEGQFDEAAKRYEALAALHPEVPAYRDAVRILREKASHAR
jgi:hypothetical protein